MNYIRRELILPGLVVALGLLLPLGAAQAQGRGIQASAYSNNVGLSGRPTSTFQSYRSGTGQAVELKPAEPGYTGTLPEYQVTTFHHTPQARKVQLLPTSSSVTQQPAKKPVFRQVNTSSNQPRPQVIPSQGQATGPVVQHQTARVTLETAPVQARPVTGRWINLPPPGYSEGNYPPPGYPAPGCPDARSYGR